MKLFNLNAQYVVIITLWKSMIICLFQPRAMTLKNYRSLSKILHLIWRSLVCHMLRTSMHSSTAASIHLWRQLPESICPLCRILSQVNRCSVLQDNCTPTGAVALVERMRKTVISVVHHSPIQFQQLTVDLTFDLGLHDLIDSTEIFSGQE